MKDRILREDALKHVHTCAYRGQKATAESLAGALGVRLDHAVDVLEQLESLDLVLRQEADFDLTESGRTYALHVIRAHRLYETYLAEETGYSEATWHHRAEAKEHKMSDAELDRMARKLGDPRFDPHGDPIPTKDGTLPAMHGLSLLAYPAGWEGRVLHIEDEPDTIYADIAAAGLAPGMRIRITASDSRTVRLIAEGRDVVFSKAMAANVQVRELAPAESFDDDLMRLDALGEDMEAEVVGLSPSCRGAERHRLLDLGVVPGTRVTIDLVSPSGNPRAYRIRGASIALRTEQAARILIRKMEA